MLNPYKPQIYSQLTADVFMCEMHKTGNGLIFWNLRLLSKGTLVDAFHWDRHESPCLKYQANDTILAYGRWSSKQRNRFQILSSSIMSSTAANDELYDIYEPKQLSLLVKLK